MPDRYSKDTKRKILEHLLFEDMNTIRLSKLLGIREFAIRRHLEFMEKEGLVTCAFKQIGMGRPRKIYSLTAKGRDTISKQSPLVASFLIENMIRRSGKEYVKAILYDVLNEIVKHYTPNASDLEGRVKEYVEFLNEFDCYASYSKENESYVLLKRNCVISDIAKQYEDIICEADTQATIKVLGNVKLIRAACLPKGDKICKYIITPLQSDESKSK